MSENQACENNECQCGCACEEAEVPAAELTPEGRIAQLEAELSAKHNDYLRARADYENLRKRAQKEREGLYEGTENRVLMRFLPVLDNLERAAAQSADEGISMIARQFMSVLEEFGVAPSGTAGDRFDPNFHEAVRHAGEGGDIVIDQVLSQGYKRGERLLRQATVMTRSVE